MTTAATLAITPEILREHGLTAEEYEKIKHCSADANPRITELGIFSVMWSEHCSYKSSRVHLKRLPTRSRRVVQGPGENAGIIDIGDGWACAFKIESHNHPSFIEPFQGATTGVGGILRDIFTMGARPVAVMDSLRFGPIRITSGRRRRTSKSAAPRPNPHRRKFTRIIPFSKAWSAASLLTETASVFPTLAAKPNSSLAIPAIRWSMLLRLGLVRSDQIFYAKAAGEGNPVIYVGSKTGRDGIHGATMASEEFSEASEAKRPNVQVGDPFLEKLLLEACLEAMQTGAIVGIQDMGAAGLPAQPARWARAATLGLKLNSTACRNAKPA